MTEVIPGLFVGSFAEASDEHWLTSHSVTHILNMARELPEYFPNRFVYKKIPMDDAETCKMTKYFRDIVEFIDSAMSKRKAVLVHCMMGISRSVTAVLVYLIEKKGMELSAARKLLKSKRPQVKPNRGFITQLINYEITQLRRHPHSDKEASPFKMHKSILNSQSPKQPAGQSILASLITELENAKPGMNLSPSQTKLPQRSVTELITGHAPIKISSPMAEPIPIILHPKELLRPSKNLIEYVTSKGIFCKRSRSNPSCNSPKDSSKSRGETLDEFEIRQYPTHKNFSSFEHHASNDRSLLSSSSPVQLDDAAESPAQERLSLQSKPLDGQEPSIFQKLKTKSILANSTLVCVNSDNKQTKSGGNAITQVVMKKIQDRKDYSTKPSELLLWHEDGTKTSKFQSMGNYDASTKSSLHPNPKLGGEPTLEMRIGQHRVSLEHIGLDPTIDQRGGQNMNLHVKLPSKENLDLESPLKSPNRMFASHLKQTSETPKLTVQERLDVFRSKNTIESVPKFFHGLQRKEGNRKLAQKLPSEEYMYSTQTTSAVASPPKMKKVSPISMQTVEGIPSPKRVAPLDSKNDTSRIQDGEASSNKMTKLNSTATISHPKTKVKPMMNKFSIGNVSLPLCQDKSVNTAGSKTPSSVFIKGGRVIAKDSLTSPKQPAYSSIFSLTRVIDHENLISSLAVAGEHSKVLAQKGAPADQIPKKGLTKCFSKKASETQILTIKDLRKGETGVQIQDPATKGAVGGSPGLHSAAQSLSKDKKPLLHTRVMASLVESTAKLEEASARFMSQKGIGATYLRYSQPNIRKPVVQKLGSGTDSRVLLYQEEKKQSIKEGSLNIYNLKSPQNSTKKPDVDEPSDASFKRTLKDGASASSGISSPTKGILKSSSFADRKLSLNEACPPSRFQRVASILKGAGVSPSKHETCKHHSGVNSPGQLANSKQLCQLEQSVSSVKGVLSTSKPLCSPTEGPNTGGSKTLSKQPPLGTISQHHKYFLGFAGISRTDPAELGRQKKPASALCWESTKPFI